MHYLLCFHGMDVGLVYNLPRKVRVFMYGFPGKAMEATDCNEATTWYMATNSKYDEDGKFMEDLRLTIGDKRYEQYCVFSGDLTSADANRVPDLFFEDEARIFRTGLFELPARFKRVFLKESYSSVDKRFYKPGDQRKLNVQTLHEALEPITKKGAKFPKKGFVTYFLEPGKIGNRRLKSLNFVLVPQPKYYHSYLDLCRSAGKVIPGSYVSTKSQRKRKQKKGIPKLSGHRVPSRSKYKYDTSIPNTKNTREAKIVQTIVQENQGLYLSDVVRFLCDRHPEGQITLVVSACRVFHSQLPGPVKRRQSATARMTVSQYLEQRS